MPPVWSAAGCWQAALEHIALPPWLWSAPLASRCMASSALHGLLIQVSCGMLYCRSYSVGYDAVTCTYWPMYSHWKPLPERVWNGERRHMYGAIHFFYSCALTAYRTVQTSKLNARLLRPY